MLEFFMNDVFKIYNKILVVNRFDDMASTLRNFGRDVKSVYIFRKYDAPKYYPISNNTFFLGKPFSSVHESIFLEEEKYDAIILPDFFEDNEANIFSNLIEDLIYHLKDESSFLIYHMDNLKFADILFSYVTNPYTSAVIKTQFESDNHTFISFKK